VIARRGFLGGIAAALVVPWARAQPVAKRRIGFLYFASRQAAIESGRYPAFVQGLREAGLVEGANVDILARFADGDAARVGPIVAEALRANPDVIVAAGSQFYLTLRDARSTVPVVVTVGPDPVALGIAASIAKPGGRFTGLTDGADSLVPKQLELIREAVPRLARVGVLLNPTNQSHRSQARRLAAACRSAGVASIEADAASSAALVPALASLGKSRAQAVILFGDTLFTGAMPSIASEALAHRMASMYLVPLFPEAGGLMSYGPDLNDNFRRAGTFVDRILKGAKPGDLPFEHPSTYQLVINLRTAKALGLALPPSLAARADRVIE
jgi:putative ABC transport system substrate-binding protein